MLNVSLGCKLVINLGDYRRASYFGALHDGMGQKEQWVWAKRLKRRKETKQLAFIFIQI